MMRSEEGRVYYTTDVMFASWEECEIRLGSKKYKTARHELLHEQKSLELVQTRSSLKQLQHFNNSGPSMESQQLFCLRWSNHQTNMLSVFDRLLQSEALVDVTLACEGLSFRAHKMVLSACSPYFQSLFMENPCKHPIVILKDIKYSDLRALVDFMYKGEVNVNHDQLSALIKTAEILKVKGLTEIMSPKTSNDESKSSINPPSPKRKKIRHHSRPTQQNSQSALKEALNPNHNLPVISGSPELIESKVDVPEQPEEDVVMVDEVEVSKIDTDKSQNDCAESVSSQTDQEKASPSPKRKSVSCKTSSDSSPPPTKGVETAGGRDQHREDTDDSNSPSLQHPRPEFRFHQEWFHSPVPPVAQQLISNCNSNCNSNSSINLKKGHPRILNEEEEAMIVRYVLDMDRIGKLVTRKCVIDYGNMLLRRHDRVPTGSIHCNPSKGLSNDWWKEFKKRHNELPFCRHPASNT